MSQIPSLFLASTALFVGAVGSGLALKEANQALTIATASAPAAQVQELHHLIQEIHTHSSPHTPTFIHRFQTLFSEHVQPLVTNISSLQAEIANLRATQQTLTSIEERLKALENTLPHTVEKNTVEHLRAEITTLQSQTTGIDTLHHQITDLETRFQTFTTQIANTIRQTVQDQTQHLNHQITEIRNRTDLTQTLETLTKEMIATQQAIEHIQLSLKNTQTQIATLVAMTPNLSDTLSTLQARLETLESRSPPTPPTLEQLLAQATPTERDMIGQFGLTVTLAHPRQIIDAISQYLQEQEKRETQARPVRPELIAEVFHPNSGALRAGPPDAPRRVALMTDHNCPFCRRAVSLIQTLLEQGDVEIFIYEMPILSAQSYEAALVSAAAARLDPRRALDLYLTLGNHEGRLDRTTMLNKAASLGFDRDVLRQESEKEETKNTIGQSLNLARRLGITGTPGFIAQDLLIQGLQPDLVIQALRRPR